LALFATSLAALVACNAILGVEDVRLKKDGGSDSSRDDAPDGEDVFQPETGPPDAQNVLEVALGGTHSCARKPEGPVKCWGDDQNGQTGTGGPADAGYLDEPKSVDTVPDAIDVASGKKHTCAVRKTGIVSCWGYNLDGQLGNGQTNTRSPIPVDVTGLGDGVAVAGGGNFSCAIRKSGGVACWGANGLGQLGNGGTTPSATRVPVSTVTGALALAAGDAHACAVAGNGGVMCWGANEVGQLGNGTSNATPNAMPVAVQNVTGAVAVVAADRSTCALTKAGGVLCWGANEHGQLGNGTANAGPNGTPVAVGNLGDAIAVGAGGAHACAVRRAGNVVCWGAGSSGQLGDGQSRPDAATPQASIVSVSAITNALGVGAGGDHSCAPTRTGTIACWGSNVRGQLGNRSTISESSPVSVMGYP